MKNSLYLLALAVFLSSIAHAEDVFTVTSSGDWDGKPAISADGVFSKKNKQRLISMKTFEVQPDMEYTLSGEFRLVNVKKATPFFFGFLPRSAENIRIQCQNYRQLRNTSISEVAEDAKAGAREVKVTKAVNYPESRKGVFAAFNAKADNSDLPNFDIVPFKSAKTANGVTVITLQTPLKKDVKKGSLLRLQCIGADFIYVASTGKKLSADWQTLRGKVKMSGRGHRWSPGTKKAQVVMLGGAEDGMIEFRNIKVSAEKVK